MKKILSTIITFIIIIGSQNLKAQIASDTIGCVPLLVKFKSPDPNIAKPFWDFKDGASSDKVNPLHVFPYPGTFVVEVYDGSNLKSTVKITVLPKVDAMIEVDTNQGCAPISIRFFDKSVIPQGLTITKYEWDFGDNSGSSTANPIHTYQNTGKFDVALNIYTNIDQCNVTEVYEDYITINDKLNLTFNTDSINPKCDFPTKVLIDFTGEVYNDASYTWDFGNGQTSTQIEPGLITYDKAKLYDVTLTVNNNKGCVAKIKKQIDLRGVQFDLTVEDSICKGKEIKILNNSFGKSFAWDFGSKANVKTSNSKSPVGIKYDSIGTFLIKLSAKSELGCKKDTSFKIVVSTAKADFDVLPGYLCDFPGELVFVAKDKTYKDYRWNDSLAGSTFKVQFSDVQRDTFYYNQLDTFKMVLNATADNGCNAVLKKNILLAKPNAQFELDEHEGEAPFVVTITDKSEALEPIVKWTFTWGDGTMDMYDVNTIKDVTHFYENPGKYYINLAIETVNGCHDDHFGAWIEVHEIPNVIKDPGTCNCNNTKPILCYKDVVTVSVSNVSPLIDYLEINFGNNMHNCELEHFGTHNGLDDPGWYNITATMANGNVFYESKPPLPIRVHGAKALIDYEVKCDDENRYKVAFINKSINAISFYWVVEGQTILANEFVHDFKKPGDYKVELVAVNPEGGCLDDRVEQTISLRKPEANIITAPKWCPNNPTNLIAINSKDVHKGCDIGYLWSFPKELKIGNIMTGKDTVDGRLPPGEHRISLEVRDVNGCRDTAYTTVFVNRVEANFTMDKPALCAPISANFLSTSITTDPIVKYQWGFDTLKNSASVKHVFDKIFPDSMLVSLTITDALGCQATESYWFDTYVPESEIIIDSVFCETNQAVFEASDFDVYGSSLTYNWSVDNAFVSDKNKATIKNLLPGKHAGQLTIKEIATGCPNTYNFEFFVTKEPIPVISGLQDSIFCFPKTLTLSSINSIVDSLDKPFFFWRINGRTVNSPDLLETFKKGKYTVSLVASSKFGCSNSVKKDIKLVGPEGTLVADKEKICKGDKITFTLKNAVDVTSWSWDFGQGEVDANKSPISYNYNFLPPSGNTFASLVLFSADTDCETVLLAPVKMHEVEARFVGDTTCESTMTLNNLSIGADTLVWLGMNKDILGFGDQIVIGNTPGITSIKLAIHNTEFGCRDTMTQMIQFLPPPISKIPPSLVLCQNSTIKLPIDKTLEYTFTPENLVTRVGSDSIIIKGSSQDLTYTVKSKEGCVKDGSVIFTIEPNIFIDSTANIYVCGDDPGIVSLGLNVPPKGIISWYINGKLAGTDILSCNDCPNPVLVSSFSGGILAVIQDLENCLTKNVEYNLEPAEIKMPNVFSPNDDMTNDLFRPVITNNVASELIIDNLQIYNRWGKKVFESNAPWDGKINGNSAPSEVYYFSVQYRVGTSCQSSTKGDVTLIR